MLVEFTSPFSVATSFSFVFPDIPQEFVFCKYPTLMTGANSLQSVWVYGHHWQTPVL